MVSFLIRSSGCHLFAIAALSVAILVSPKTSFADEEILFESQVQPILASECAKCHGAKVSRSGLDLSTDALGWRAVENPVSVADWHATILHLLGLDHEELFFDRHGFKERLTGVEKVRVVHEILA